MNNPGETEEGQLRHSDDESNHSLVIGEGYHSASDSNGNNSGSDGDESYHFDRI